MHDLAGWAVRGSIIGRNSREKPQRRLKRQRATQPGRWSESRLSRAWLSRDSENLTTKPALRLIRRVEQHRPTQARARATGIGVRPALRVHHQVTTRDRPALPTW